MLGDSSDETNFPYRLLNTERQVSKLCIAFANNSSANIKLSETQLPKWYNEEDLNHDQKLYYH